MSHRVSPRGGVWLIFQIKTGSCELGTRVAESVFRLREPLGGSMTRLQTIIGAFACCLLFTQPALACMDHEGPFIEPEPVESEPESEEEPSDDDQTEGQVQPVLVEPLADLQGVAMDAEVCRGTGIVPPGFCVSLSPAARLKIAYARRRAASWLTLERRGVSAWRRQNAARAFEVRRRRALTLSRGSPLQRGGCGVVRGHCVHEERGSGARARRV